MTDTVFVAGGTGKTGGRVVARLRERGVECRIGSRATGFDWADPAGWGDAIRDSTAAYVAYAPDLAVPASAGHLAEFGRVAAARGLRRIVLLSGRGEKEARDAEEALAASVPERTVLRASWMNQNFSEGAFAPMVADGMVVAPVGEVGEPFVDCDDIADAAVETLLTAGHTGRVYELTGPRLLTFRQATAEIAAATGRSIGYARVSLDEYTAALPPDVAALVRYLFETLFDGRNASVASGVREILGRPPRDFGSFAAMDNAFPAGK
jgi:uncharacterized protein YbjT (DUF2867 family)